MQDEVADLEKEDEQEAEEKKEEEGELLSSHPLSSWPSEHLSSFLPLILTGATEEAEKPPFSFSGICSTNDHEKRVKILIEWSIH